MSTKKPSKKLYPSPRTRGLLGGSGSREMMMAKVESGELTMEEAEAIMGVKGIETPQRQPTSQLPLLPEDSLASLLVLPEMLSDWHGAGRAQGTPDTLAWYTKNRNRMSLGGGTRTLVEFALNYWATK